MKTHTAAPALALVVALGSLSFTSAADGMAMYAWTEGFDATLPGCGEAELLAEDTACNSHNWETPESRHVSPERSEGAAYFRWLPVLIRNSSLSW